MQVRTRFAPSPTGYLHIGGVRTALFNWLFARRHGGQFILRIDDTDTQRNRDEYLAPILEGFRWLGIDWDEGPDVGGPHAPYYQSQRAERYQAAAQRLLEKGLAYRDYATADDLAAEREAAQAAKKPFLYSRRWMAETDAEAAAFESQGRQGVLRLKMPREGICRFQDHVRGDMEIEWAREQDHVIQRADGSCLYHLASVVDDHDLEITHVVRAEEHLSNTARQIFIALGLDFEPPQFAHLPYVAEPGSKNKLSKRKIAKYLKIEDFKRLFDHGQAIMQRLGREVQAETFNPVMVDFYREVGYLQDAVINYLMFLGWSLDDKTEELTREQMIANFSFERVTKAPASFDPKKLWAFQDRHFTALDVKKKVARMLPYLQEAGLVADPPPCELGPRLTKIIEICGDRLKTSGDILEYAAFFFVPASELEYDEKDFSKRVHKEGAPELLGKFRADLAQVEPFDAVHTEVALKSFVEREQIKVGAIVHPVRVAATGKGVGPGLYDCLELLGRDEVLARIDRALELAAR